MPEFTIGLLGHGTVGSSFAKLVEERADAIEAEVGMRPRLSACSRGVGATSRRYSTAAI